MVDRTVWLLVSTAVVLVQMASIAAAPAARSFLKRPAVPHLRVMTWNVGYNSIFTDPGPRGHQGSDAGRPIRFRHVIKAVKPDIVCLQEVFEPRRAVDVAAILDESVPLADAARWQAHGQSDVVIASRFPISMRASRREDWGAGVPRTHVMGLIQLPASLAVEGLYVVGVHAQSRGEPRHVKARQEQADAIASWVRDLRTPGGVADLAARTPIVILGDLNAYRTDSAHHVTTLLTGRISNRSRFGSGGSLDWDDSPLRDARPVHNGSGSATHTFGHGSASLYPPGELDRVLFTDSVLTMLGGFVLDTTALTPAELSRSGLNADDIVLNTTTGLIDHLPVVVDFILTDSRRE